VNNTPHIAIIMDGNGRWAKNKQKQRTFGHQKGAQNVRFVLKHCRKIGIKYLTLYAFSTENWTRPKLEVEFLLKLLEKYLKQELNLYIQNNIKFDTIGDISIFPKKLQNLIKTTKEKTYHCDGMTQVLALNYGAKDEIIRAIKKLKDKQNINEKIFAKFLDTKDLPDIDMLIRTGGEHRVSNFLLWQISYAEIFFSDTMWPDFTTSELDDMITKFKEKHRRYGGD